MGDFVLTGGGDPGHGCGGLPVPHGGGGAARGELLHRREPLERPFEYPQYSRPEEWHGRKVPAILLSGNHGGVDDWRRKESYKRTMARRPDLWARFDESAVKTKHDKKDPSAGQGRIHRRMGTKKNNMCCKERQGCSIASLPFRSTA